jgi:hypothetical protein
MQGPCKAMSGAFRLIVKKIISRRQLCQCFCDFIAYAFNRRQGTFDVLP